MEVYLVIVLETHVLRIESLVPKWVGLHESGCDALVDLGEELGHRTYADLLLAIFGTPDRKRSAPVTATAEVPVLDVLEPLSETSGTGRFRFPGNLLIESHHLILDGSSLDKPSVERIVEHRLVGPPAMRVAMYMFLNLECAAVGLHHHAEIDVEGRSVCRKSVIEGVLDVAAGEFGI